VVFGGDHLGTLRDDAWAWNGTTWRQLPSLPSPRTKPAVAYDSNRGRIACLGGIGLWGLIGDHIEWDGSTWTWVSSPPFPAHDRGAAGYDPQRALLVFKPHDRFQPTPTWTWDGSTWTAGATNGPRQPGRSLVWNLRRQRLETVCFGNTSPTAHFALDGNGWTETSVADPDAGGVPIYDVARGQLLDFRGRSMVGWPDLAPQQSDLGSACGRVDSLGSLTSFGPPRLGDLEWCLDVRACAPSSPSLLAIGFTAGSLPIGAGCTVVVPTPASLAFASTDQFGCVRYRLPLPIDPGLRGVVLVAQAATVDALAPLGLALTQGMRLRLGD
jgi:hypothetical protein